MLLRFYNVSSLRATVTINDIKLYILTFCQRFEAFVLDRRVMYEYIATVFTFNKTITFFCAKPFYFTVHNKILLKKQFQLSCSSSVSVT